MTTSPLRSLHVGNGANVAYGYGKILNRHAAPATVICHDVRHLISQPEWDDLPLNPLDFPDQWDFFNNTADFGDYRRPSWFHGGAVVDPYLAAGPMHARLRSWVARRMSSATRRRLEPLYYRAQRLRLRVQRRIAIRDESTAARDRQAQQRLNRAVALAAALGPEWTIDKTVLERYLPHSDWLAGYADGHDVIVAYMIAPIYGLLYGQKPQVSVEIGTMRDIPFGSSVTASMLWPAYRYSDHVILTNPDNRVLAEAAGIESYSFCPHPIDDRMFRPGDEPELRQELLARYGADVLLFAPARQNWAIKGNDKVLAGMAKLRRAGLRAVLLAPAWGQEVARSKALARDLGLQESVAWLPPMPEPLLARHYRAVDLVLDQFQLGVFGLITPKAMASGVPVLTSYERRHHAWCFPEDPPVVSCWTGDDIADAVLRLASDHGRRRELGAASRAWVDRYHSPAVVVEALTAAMQTAVDRFASRR